MIRSTAALLIISSQSAKLAVYRDELVGEAEGAAPWLSRR